MKAILMTILHTIGLIASFMVSLLVIFWVGFAAGWLSKILIGTQLCYALNLLFNTTRFDPSALPWLCGAFAWGSAMIKGFKLKLSLESKS